MGYVYTATPKCAMGGIIPNMTNKGIGPKVNSPLMGMTFASTIHSSCFLLAKLAYCSLWSRQLIVNSLADSLAPKTFF